MESITNEVFAENLSQLSAYNNLCLNGLLEILKTDELVLGILFGGFLSYKKVQGQTDADLFCLINDIGRFETKLNTFKDRIDIETIIYQGFFQWTQKLYSIYFKQDPDFSIDLCLIDTNKDAEQFFWEPNGVIVFDRLNIIFNCRQSQLSKSDYSSQPFLKSNPFSHAVISIKKIHKNLLRLHLWNALEQLSISRRYAMQIIRIGILKETQFLGRVDRDIEDVLPSDLNEKFTATLANYEAKDIARKTISLIEMLESVKDAILSSNENNVQDWILKQLGNEKMKLQNLIDNA